MHDDWPSFQRRLNDLVAALEDAEDGQPERGGRLGKEDGPSPRWLHARSHDGSIVSYAPRESAIEAVRRAQRRTAWTQAR